MHFFSAADTEPFDPASLSSWLTWFTGTPLRLLVIALIGAIALLIMHRVIKTTTEHLADGTWMNRGLREPGAGDAGDRKSVV